MSDNGGNGDGRDERLPIDPLGDPIDEEGAEAEEVLREVLARNPDATLEELNAALRAHTEAADRPPQREMGGLSPDQVQRLLGADWDEATGPIRLNRALGIEEIGEARALHNARLLLEYLEAEGGARATARGNLSRAAVAALIDRMRWPDGYLDELRRVSRVVNEEDVFPLHTLRVVLGLGGLIKRRGSTFSLTRRGAEMIPESRAGALYHLLFRTTFRKLNLGYLDHLPPVADFQRTLSYSLFRLGLVAGGWRRAGELVDQVILPFVRLQLPRQELYDPLASVLETRLLRPLEGFGLIEWREVAGRHPLLPEHAYRKTRLYDRFLRFHLPPVLPISGGVVH